MKKKIVFVLTAMNIGGTEKALLNLVDTMSPEKYSVTFLLLHKTGGFLSEVPEWVEIQEIKDYSKIEYETVTPPIQLVIRYLKEFRLSRAFGIAWRHLIFRLTKDRSDYYRYVLQGCSRKEEYDTAIAFEGPADFITTYVLNCISAKEKIQWIHFDVSKYLFHLRTAKRLYPQYDKICVVSDEARQALLHMVPEIAEKTKTVRNIVSEKRCKELAEIGTGFQDDFNGIRILTVGRLSEEKGQDIIPEIAKILKENKIDFRWYIIGDGELRKYIEDKNINYQLTREVQLMGAVTNPYTFFKDADLYVQTSLHEGFCITLAEAKVFDLPIVATECLGAHEQLDEYEKSRVVSRNIEKITKEIVNLAEKEWER